MRIKGRQHIDSLIRLMTPCSVCVVCKAMEGDGEVIISPVQNCSHCDSGECHEIKDGVACYCDDDLILAPDGVSCINVTGQKSAAHSHTSSFKSVCFYFPNLHKKLHFSCEHMNLDKLFILEDSFP